MVRPQAFTEIKYPAHYRQAPPVDLIPEIYGGIYGRARMTAPVARRSVQETRLEEVLMSLTTGQPSRGSYLMPSLQHATVSDAMHPGILACEPDASLPEVAQIMATHHVHCVAVIGVSHEEPQCGVWSVISDLDLVRAGIRDGEALSARVIAQQPLVTVEPSLPLREGGELMLANRVSHLVVIQPGTQRPIGVLSTADIAGVLGWGEA